MARLIDGDMLTEKLKQHREYHLDDSQSGVYIAEGISQCIDILNGRESPTADAVPVVRCWECKHSKPWYRDKYRCFFWVKTGVDVFKDGFCSYGKHKGEDE